MKFVSVGFVVFELWELNLLGRLCETTRCWLEGWGTSYVPKLLSFLSCLYRACPRTDILYVRFVTNLKVIPVATDTPPTVNSNFVN
jgi:hypothetical protein